MEAPETESNCLTDTLPLSNSTELFVLQLFGTYDVDEKYNERIQRNRESINSILNRSLCPGYTLFMSNSCESGDDCFQIDEAI